VTVGCSNVLCCCEVWCSRRGGWWRGRPRNRLDRPPPHVASYSSFTLPWDGTMPPCYIIDSLWPAHTGTPTGGHASQSPSPPPVKQICYGNIHSAAESVGEEGEERRVVNNRCKTTCTSWRRPLLDNAGTRRRWGRGRKRRPVQQTICNYTDLPVDLLGRPVGGQATAHDGTADREVWTEVRGSSLIISNASNRSSLTAASAHIPISRIDHRDTRTRIHLDNWFFDHRLTCLNTSVCVWHLQMTLGMCVSQRWKFATYNVIFPITDTNSHCIFS